RFFIEHATAVNPEEWQNQRYTDENGQIIVEDGEVVDFMGAPPEGGILYERLWMCAEHANCGCRGNPQTNIGLTDRGWCYGEYRDPNMRDVREMERRWQNTVTTRDESYGLRAAVPSGVLAKNVKADYFATQDYWNKVEQEINDDMYQSMTPFK